MLSSTVIFKNRQLKVTLDTGAAASLFTKSICRSAGIPILPEADGQSYLPIIGEINIYLNCEEIPLLHLTALVVPKLDCEILAGMLFIMSNQIVINTPKLVITIHNKYDINFSSLGDSKSSIIRSPINRVLFPRDSIQVPVSQDFINYHEFSVEPRTEFKENWPKPSIIKNEQTIFTLSNTAKLPISIKRNQIIAQIRNIYNVEDLETINHTPTHPPSDIRSNYLEIKVDPQNQLHPHQIEKFKDINKTYQNVFKENFSSI